MEQTMNKKNILFVLASIMLVMSSLAIAQEKAQKALEIPVRGMQPMHIDPLDESRASALHRGPNPHAKLTAAQHMEVAAQHLEANRIPQAMAVLGQALVQYPENAALYNMRASIEISQNNIKDALYDMEQAVRLKPDNALYHLSRSQLYLRFERKEEALADLNRALELNDKLIPAYFNRGALLANMGREQQALQDFDKIIQMEPRLPAPYFNRGAMYYALGNKQKARADINKFIQLANVSQWKKAGQDLLKAWDEADKKSTSAEPGKG